MENELERLRRIVKEAVELMKQPAYGCDDTALDHYREGREVLEAEIQAWEDAETQVALDAAPQAGAPLSLVEFRAIKQAVDSAPSPIAAWESATNKSKGI